MSALEIVMMKRIGELNAEVKYLQDKVERLTAEVSYDKRVQLHVDKLAAEFTQWEVERLKAEVERLAKELSDEKSANANVEARQNSANRGLSMDNFNLKAEVERLRKAGDAVCESPYLFETDPAVIAWRAAKEGKKP